MPELSTVPFVIFGNKVDKKEALGEEQLRDVMGLPFHQTSGKDAS